MDSEMLEFLLKALSEDMNTPEYKEHSDKMDAALEHMRTVAENKLNELAKHIEDEAMTYAEKHGLTRHDMVTVLQALALRL